MQNKRTFVSRFFELFTLPANLKLNTQRRSAPSMCAFKEEERSVLISVTLMKGITGYKITVSTIGITVCKWRVQPCDSDLKERFLSLIVCLFILLFFLVATHISRFFSSYFFCYLHFFFPCAFSHPHPPSAGIRSTIYRHPFTVHYFYTLISSFTHFLSIKIVLSCFYLLSFYFEKFSTWIWRLPYTWSLNSLIYRISQTSSKCG